MARLLGCCGLLALVAFLGVEVWFFILVSGWMNQLLYHESGHEVVGCLLLLVVLMLVGWRAATWHIRQLPLAFMAGQGGRHCIGALGGVLLIIPGFLSDLVGLVLLLPPVQIALGIMGNKLLTVIFRAAMGRMMGGKMPGGFPGGFPAGFPGGASPGRLQPDEALRFPGMRPRGGKPKTYDTTAEK